MNKLWLIIKREYLVRVKKKSFIIATLLTPIGIGLLVFFSGYIAAKGGQAEQNILIKDDSGILKDKDISSELLKFEFSEAPIKRLIEDYKTQGYDILIHVPAFDDLKATRHDVDYYATEKLGITTIEGVERKIGSAFKDYKILKSGIEKETYDSFKTNIELENAAQKLEDKDSKEDKSSKLSIVIGTMLGGIMGFIMYMVIFIYGSMVMRSVMEEKINRIVEVMISSVKPTQLMLGKVLGVGAVGLTQLGIWMILIPVVVSVSSLVLGFSVNPEELTQVAAQNGDLATQELQNFEFGNVLREIMNLNWWLIIPVFVIFFFGGYFIYSSLFAAVGSAMGDDMGEGQQLMLPIILPVILALVMMQGVIQNPNGGMAVFGSLFPLTSPIIMPSRLAFDPPMWQIILSILIMVLSCLFFAWFAGRIYRVGILLYGKKVSFKEIARWITYKG